MFGATARRHIPVIGGGEHLTVGIQGIEKRIISNYWIKEGSYELTTLTIEQIDGTPMAWVDDNELMEATYRDVQKAMGQAGRNDRVIDIAGRNIEARLVRCYFANFYVGDPYLKIWLHGADPNNARQNIFITRDESQVEQLRGTYINFLTQLHQCSRSVAVAAAKSYG